MIENLNKNKVYLEYEIIEVEDNSLEIYVEINKMKTKVFSRKLTGKWLNAVNIVIVMKKITELIQ